VENAIANAFHIFEEIIQMEGPNTIAAILVEGITGSNGLLVPPDDYYPKLRALCDKYGVLLIDDEVMSDLAEPENGSLRNISAFVRIS